MTLSFALPLSEIAVSAVPTPCGVLGVRGNKAQLQICLRFFSAAPQPLVQECAEHRSESLCVLLALRSTDTLLPLFGAPAICLSSVAVRPSDPSTTRFRKAS